jgi:hypothetical protein
MEFLDERGQFKVFRNNLTVLAGFRDVYYNILGEPRVEAKSLAYGSMEEDEFELHYRALVGAAMVHIFKGCGSETEDKLMGFF